MTDEVTPPTEVDTAPDMDAVEDDTVEVKSAKKRRRKKDVEVEVGTVFGQNETQ